MRSKIDIYINRIAVVFITLCGLELYNIRGLGRGSKAIQLVGAGMIIVFLILHAVYKQNNGKIIPQHFRVFILVLLIALVPSMFNAAYFYGQSISESLYEQRDIYFYLSYFLFHQMRLSRKFLEKLIFNFGIVYLLFYIIQYLIYPTVLFDVGIMEDRNTLRISLVGVTFAFLNYFFCLQNYFITKKIKYVIVMVATIIVAILLGGRQVVFMIFLVTILFLLFDGHVKYKPAIVLLSMGALLSVYMIFQTVFDAFIDASLEIKQSGAEYVRIRAIKYFLFKFFPNNWTYLFGNGNPSGDSAYGRAIDRLMTEKGFFISDIGMFGVYVYYGLFFVFSSILIIVRGLILKVKDNGKYIKYYLIMVLQATLTGIGFISSGFIITYCIMLYLLDTYAEQTRKINHTSLNEPSSKQFTFETVY